MMQVASKIPTFMNGGVSSQRRVFFSTSQPKQKILYMTIQEVLKLKGPRELKPYKAFSKILERSTSRKKGLFVNPAVGAPYISLETAISSLTCTRAPISKRANVLNKLFMKTVTEILNTSDVGIPLLGCNIEFCQVKMNSDFSVVNIFWIPKGTDEDNEIQCLLNKVSNPLRRELINLKVMGMVPIIHFIKDKHYAILAEIDRRLRIADFGDEYIPSLKENDHLRENLQLITHFPVELKEQISKLENEEEFKEEEEMPLPSMRMDVFGLDYLKIRRTVQNGIKKSKAENSVIEEIMSDKKAVFEIPAGLEQPKICEKKNIKQYLKQKRIEIMKSRNAAFRSRENQLIASFAYENTKNQSNMDELYEEFVKNSFEDYVEEFEESNERHEQRQ